MAKYYAGIDIGSTTSKCVIIGDNETIISFQLIQTSFDRDKSGRDVYYKALEEAKLTEADIACIVSTGYGRRSLSISNDIIPEIIAHAKGTVKLYPGTRTIIDIGGQDSKVIAIDELGVIDKFEMNDKCAAGTGRFFEVLTERLLSIPMSELGLLSLQATNPPAISSMCTIFAESEIISMLSSGIPSADIAMGMNISVAKRVIAMGKAGQIRYQPPIIFSGGVANNEGVTKAFSDLLGKEVTAIRNPQNTAALGAALVAKQKAKDT
jgi:predicted CoA-substrate-specific enzyme activase